MLVRRLRERTVHGSGEPTRVLDVPLHDDGSGDVSCCPPPSTLRDEMTVSGRSHVAATAACRPSTSCTYAAALNASALRRHSANRNTCTPPGELVPGPGQRVPRRRGGAGCRFVRRPGPPAHRRPRGRLPRPRRHHLPGPGDAVHGAGHRPHHHRAARRHHPQRPGAPEGPQPRKPATATSNAASWRSAPRPRAFEVPARWLADALDDLAATRIRHRGNHRYVQVLGTQAERRQIHIAASPLTYPKQLDPTIDQRPLF